MHYTGRFDDSTFRPVSAYANYSLGYTASSLVGHRQGSVHTGLGVHQLAGYGTIWPHVHSYEESFYILSGEVLFSREDEARLLVPGDYGVIKVGALHAWRNLGDEPARWLQMSAPQPKPDGGDTFFRKSGRIPNAAEKLGPADLEGHLMGHFDVSQIPPMEERRDVMPGLEGVFLNWIIDEKFGARHHRVAFIEYQPGVSIGRHDHTFEESYFFLSGEIEADLEGEVLTATAGDYVWTGVGCVHAFANKSSEPVRWLETFSPQPPAENAFRFNAEWEKRRAELEA